MPIPVNRSCSTATAESTWWTPSQPALPAASLSHRRQPIHRRRLPTQRERRSGSRIPAGVVAVTTRRQNTDAAGLGHASCSTGRRTTCPRQQSRNHPARLRLPQRIGQQSDGSVDAAARRSSRLRPRPGPCRTAHRILALTPTKPVDPVDVTTPDSCLRWPRGATCLLPFLHPDLSSFCRLDELGLHVVGQRLQPGRAVLACRAMETEEFARWCRRCGCEAHTSR
jgi:hypothetical protein